MPKLFPTLVSVIAILGSSSAVFAQSFTLSSPDLEGGKFKDQQLLSEPYGFGCSGGNVSPRLTWSGAPEGAKSFVLTMYDKDAPTGLGWVHWVVANIPADVNELHSGITAEGNRLPAGAFQTRTDFGSAGYGGACPPQGSSHDYVITLTALKIEKLPDAITQEATPALVGFFTRANALGEATLTVNQGR
ncbi:hypothetical protein SAMN05216328_11735 [Ensifer sp. YR511]|nr:hypothetical protein SAMN05216328_11735 [Ensifer sp. YR511]